MNPDEYTTKCPDCGSTELIHLDDVEDEFAHYKQFYCADCLICLTKSFPKLQ